MNAIRKLEAFKELRERADYFELMKFARELGIPVPSDHAAKHGVTADLERVISEIYNRLQTEIMHDTVKFAKWSCFWAALAALAAMATVLISVQLQ